MRLLFVVFLGISLQSFSQTAVEYLNRVIETNLKEKTRSYSLTFQLFKGHSSNSIYSSYDGLVVQDGDYFYQKNSQSEVLVTKEFSAFIDNENKEIQLFSPLNFKRDVDVQVFLSECYVLELKSDKSKVIIDLKVKETSTLPYSRISVEIEPSTNRITKLDMYYSSMQDFSDVSLKEEMDYPHLRMIFSDYSTDIKKYKNLLSNDMIVQSNKGKFTLREDYKDYVLTDNRQQ